MLSVATTAFAAFVTSDPSGLCNDTCFSSGVCVLSAALAIAGDGGGVTELVPNRFGGNLTISVWAKNDVPAIRWGRIIDFGTNSTGAGDNILLTTFGTSGRMA